MSEPRESAEENANSDDVRSRVVAAAARLIAAGGRDAATTRSVAAAAGVQAPTIYRLFGDKRGLLDAVAEHAMTEYVADKLARPPHPDPVQDLREGWDLHVAFGLANPGLFTIMSGDPHAGAPTPAVAAGLEVLRRRIHRIALAGQLRVSEERAIALLQATGVGTVITLLSQPVPRRDPGLSAAAREAVLAAIISEPKPGEDHTARGSAAALRASLALTRVLSSGERHLLEELLDRIANDE